MGMKMIGNECLTLKQRTEKRLARTQQLQEKTRRAQQKTRLMREKFQATQERWEKLNTESALSNKRKSPLLDFVGDLVHRPPNQEQLRQLKELLLEEHRAIAQLIAALDKHLENRG
jgi:hypothetical protein